MRNCVDVPSAGMTICGGLIRAGTGERELPGSPEIEGEKRKGKRTATVSVTVLFLVGVTGFEIK